MIAPASMLASRGIEASLPTIETVRWSLPQRLAIADHRPHVLWRDGNRLGKTYWLAYELSSRLDGSHPGCVHRPPIRAIAMGPSLAQMETSGLIPLIWAFLGGDPVTGAPGPHIETRLRFEPGRGIRGPKAPVIRLPSGPGRGSIVYFCSYRQGIGRLGGMSAHVVILDEPPPESRWGEVRARTLDVGGVIRVGFTPTPSSPDVRYLREIVEGDDTGRQWGHWNHGLRAENTHVEGAPWPRFTEAAIAQFGKDLLARERKMRLEGAWEPEVEGRVLDLFDPDINVRPFTLMDIPKDHTLCVGIDHGLQANKQRAVLAAFSGVHTPKPRGWWINESIGRGETTSVEDGAGIVRMLSEVGLTVGDVDLWIGDVSARGSKYQQKRKSNRRLRASVASAAGLSPDKVGDFVTPSKREGSVWEGCRTINAMFGEVTAGTPHGLVHPRCEHFAAACDRWAGSPTDPHKDVLDAGRYPAERVCQAARPGPHAATVTHRR